MAKSVARNALYNGIRTVASMAFPLITYPYITHVLMADSIGRIDFSSSVVSYFSLIAALGISTYATREGAGCRDRRDEFRSFASEVFTINICSMIVSYVLLGLLLLLWPRLRDYGSLVAIQSLTLLGNTLAMDWVNAVYEDYGYITLRSILVQAVSAALLFLLVKGPDDYLVYAAIQAFSAMGANVFNFFYIRRYARVKLVWKFDYKKHLSPIFILFGNSIATTVYINTDVTLLGIFMGDHAVGIYGIAVRIYTLFKYFLNSLVAVSIPRLSSYCANDKQEEYQSLLASVAHGLVITVVPLLAILFLMADQTIFVIGGEGFSESVLPLRILCIAAFFAVFAHFTTATILLPNKAEGLFLRSTIYGAAANMAINLVVIPFFGVPSAAITTGIAEAVVFGVSLYYSLPYFDARRLVKGLLRPFGTAFICVAAIVAGYYLIGGLRALTIQSFFVTGIILMAVYSVSLLLQRDTIVMTFLGRILHRQPKAQ